MNNLQKTIIGWLGVVFLVVLSVYFLTSINQKINTATTTNTVSFSGEGKITAKPDVAVANLTILTEAVTSKQAQDQNSEKSKAVIGFLKKQNIDEKDMKTSGYNIYPQYNYPRNETPQIKGYQVNQTIEIKIRDLDKVSVILDGVVTAGVNQVSGLNFQIDEPEKLKDQARELAIKNAQSKAKVLKEQLGIKLGKIINFSEGISGYPTPMYFEAKSAEIGMGGGGPSIPTGENEITIQVNISYQIK